MTFQLGEIDDIVALVQIGGVGQAFQHLPGRKGGGALSEVAVEQDAFPFQRAQSGGSVDVGEGGGVVKPAGTVADDDPAAQADNFLGQDFQKRRVRCRGLFRLHAGNQVGLDDDPCTRPDKGKPAKRGEKGGKCAPYFFFVIGGTARDRYRHVRAEGGKGNTHKESFPGVYFPASSHKIH